MDRRVVLILSLVVVFTGALMMVKGHSHANNVVDLSVAQPSGVQQAANPDSAKKDADAPPPEFPEPPKGSVAPDFSLKSLSDGKEVRLSSLRGKAVLVNFWATWCEPCKIEMPALQHAYDTHKGQGFVVLGVDITDDTATTAAFVREVGVTYPIVRDQSLRTVVAYNVTDTPSTYFIDRDGVIRAKVAANKANAILNV